MPLFLWVSFPVMLKHLLFLLHLTICLALPRFVFGQEVITQKISGTVADAESKRPLTSATIIILSNTALSAFSDDQGKFTIDKVPVGRQTLQISLIGYETKT